MVIAGNLTATSGAIGGWTINATSIYTGTEDFSGYTANAGDITIYSNGTDASIHAKNWYIDTTGAFYSTAGSISGVSVTAIPNDTVTDISLLDFTHDLVFSVTDKDTVAWALGTITLSSGRTFSISASNTGNMAARTYIYLDTAVSSTALQTTTTVATAMGANKKLIAVAQNGAAEASFQVNQGIGGMKLTAGMTSISKNDWNFSGAWSVTDADTIAWGAGTLTTSNGGSYSITGSNTGNMTAKTYVYFDLAVSATALQLTTTAATAIGDGKILIAVCKNGTGEASFIVMNDQAYNIDAANIVAGSITTNEIAATTITASNIAANTITASQLTTGAFVTTSANISNAIITNAHIADLAVSKLTAGTITSKSLALAVADGTGDAEIYAGIATGDFANVGATSGFIIGIDDSDANKTKFYFGSPTRNVIFDGTDMTVNGYSVQNKFSFGGDGSDGAFTTTTGTTTIDATGLAYIIKNYTSVSITGDATVTISNPHTSGTTFVIKSQGAVTMTSSGVSINLVGLGGDKGAAVSGITDGLSGTSGKGQVHLTGGGGGGKTAGAIAGTSPTINLLAIPNPPIACPGAGGGSGASGATGTGKAGGDGGGALIIECGGAYNFTTGTISVAGVAGENGADSRGPGGGGGGGTVFVMYDSVTADSGTYTASGGAGGTAGSNPGSEGGAGGGSLKNIGGGGSGTGIAGGAGGNGEAIRFLV